MASRLPAGVMPGHEDTVNVAMREFEEDKKRKDPLHGSVTGFNKTAEGRREREQKKQSQRAKEKERLEAADSYMETVRRCVESRASLIRAGADTNDVPAG